MSDETYARSVDLMEAGFGDDLVALDRASGRCLSFNAVAADVWRMLDTPKTVDQIVEKLRAEYDVELAECRGDVTLLLTDLEKKGLVATQRATL